MIGVHLSFSVIVSSVYLPAGTAVPPTVTSVLITNVVASLAPARHTSPYGTSFPNILRPFMLGTE